MERKKKTFCRTTGLALLAAALLALCPAAGEAASLADILKEKGVITSAEYQQATKDQPIVSYQAGKGLTVESADGNSKLQIGGWAQLWYVYTDADKSSGESSNNIRARNFKLALKGTLFSKNIGYKYQADLAKGFTTEDLYLNYKFGAPLMVQVGQFKPPQSRQELTSLAKQLFVNRSLANDTFDLGRDTGVQASGAFWKKLLEYRLGVFDGNGPNTNNPDNRMMLAGRIDINPLGPVPLDEAAWYSEKPLLNVGGSVAYEKMGPNDVGTKFNTDDDVLDVALNLDGLTSTSFTAAYGSDLSWLLRTVNADAYWLGCSLAAEYYALTASPQLGSDWNADGYYVQAGYQIIPQKLEVGARYSAIKSTDDNASAKFDKNETQFGANYYFAKHNLELQADFTLVNDNLNDGKDDRVFRMQAQFYF